MDETSQVVDILDELVTSTSATVPIKVSEPARSGLEKIRCALELRDITTLVLSHSDGILSKAPSELTDPEDIKYFNLYRESFTVEQFQVPKSQRGPNSHPRGFKGAVRRAINATRFITTRRTAERSAELDTEMDKVLSWDTFNVNTVSILSDRQPLMLVGLMALNHFGLLATFGIDQEVAVNFLRAVEHHYLPNPYHNSAHAADVTQALLAILVQDSLHTKFTDLELLALLISSTIHDVGHPGFSNPFLTKTQDEQALMYNDQSANEALSLSIGFKILQAPECNLFVNLSREDYFYLRKLITSIVLGTDMAVHSQIVEAARAILHTNNADSDVWSDKAHAEHRLTAMKTIMHVADISNASRPPWLAGMWTRAVYDEFFKQGDAEKEMQLDVSPLCDRATVAVAESQKAFLNFVVTPTWDLLKDIAPKSHSIALQHLSNNLNDWMVIADTGDAQRVLNDDAEQNATQPLHVSPNPSPFHNNDHASWGSAAMLLLLLNDETNNVIGTGLKYIVNPDQDPKRQQAPSSDPDQTMQL